MEKKNVAMAATMALAAGVCALPRTAMAEDPPASPLSFNVGVVSDYRYRGISQTRLKPALQGGADYVLPYGFYIGTWASTIKWIKDAGTAAGVDTGSAPAEIDFYGGYKGDIVKETLSYDVGGLYYFYAGNHYDKLGAGASKADTFELYGSLTWLMFTAKYSYALTTIFGFGGNGLPSSRGSGYLDLAANFDLGSGFTLTPHVGRQSIRHYGTFSYTDYSLTLAKDLGSGFSLTATAQGTNARKIAGVPVYASPDGKNLGKNTLVVGAKYTF